MYLVTVTQMIMVTELTHHTNVSDSVDHTHKYKNFHPF